MRRLLDASAVLALLRREPGADLVAARLADSAMSAVNLAEVLSVLIRAGAAAEDAVAAFSILQVPVLDFGARDAETAAVLLSSDMDGRALSLGDRACLATAHGHGVPAMTADRRWSDLHIGVEIELIR